MPVMPFESDGQREAYERLRAPFEELFPGVRERIHAIGYAYEVDGTTATSTLAPWGDGDTIIANRCYLAGAVPMSEALLRQLATARGEERPEGRVTNPDLVGYAVPTALDAPELITDIVESRRADGLAGVKGVGEAPICATPAAIANAVRDALGVPVRRLPLSGERVLEALEADA